MKTLHDWKQHIEGWETSGLSRRAYCQEQGLSYSTFQYNFKKYRQKAHKDTSKFQPVGFMDDDFLKEQKQGDSRDIINFRISSDGSVKVEVNISLCFSSAGFL